MTCTLSAAEYFVTLFVRMGPFRCIETRYLIDLDEVWIEKKVTVSPKRLCSTLKDP